MSETRRIEIDPLTRLEGHGKVTLRLDEAGQVADAQLHVVEFRGFERFVQGRPYEEIPVLVQRLCGICPVSHHLAAAKAMDTIAGASQLTPSAQKLRRLLHLAQVLQSHALHFFYLASPDLLFGISDARAKRGVMAVLDAYPEVALQGIRLRKFGQQIIEALAGKRIHGVMALPGGVNKHLALRDREVLLAQADAVVESAERAVALVADVQRRQPALFGAFGRVASNCLSLVGPEDDLELYDGRLRAIDATGHPIVESLEPAQYAELISEAVQPWSYMKFPYIRQLGSEAGWYRVGPLARLKTCASITTPLAEASRQDFFAECGPQPDGCLNYHRARMIELLHCSEAIRDVLNDADLVSGERMAALGPRRDEGIGVIEAPRGTLIHHYRVDSQGLVTWANLIVATTNNNSAMNATIREVAGEYLSHGNPDDGLLSSVEVAVRAYDPCISCAAHAVGQMPLQLEVLDASGVVAVRLARDGSGRTKQLPA